MFQQTRTIRTQCETRHLSGDLKTYVAVEQCANPPILAIYRAEHFPHVDVIENAQAQRLAVAEQRDRGELTDIQAAARLSDIRLQQRLVMERRDAADDANALAAAALIQSTIPKPMTCTTVSGITNCY